MFRYLIITKKIEFFYKKPTDDNPNYLWVVTVQDWHRTSPANAVFPSGIFNFCNVIDIDILLVKKSKINAAFLIINEQK